MNILKISNTVTAKQIFTAKESPRNDVKIDNGTNHDNNVINDNSSIGSQTKFKEVKDHDWKKMIEKINKALEGSGRHFKYEVHKPTNEVMISVIDDETNEVIREIPSKKLLDLIAKIWEMAGLFVDERR